MKHNNKKPCAILLSIAFLFLSTPQIQAKADTCPIPEMVEDDYVNNDGLLVSATPNTLETSVTEAEEQLVGATETTELPSAYQIPEEESTSVKDQGSDGLCWSFSSLGACETYILHNHMTIPDCYRNSDGEVDLSEGGLGYYIYTNHARSGDFTSGDYLSLNGKGAGGGNVFIAGSAMAAGCGLLAESEAPFENFESGYSEYLRNTSAYQLEEQSAIETLGTGNEDIVKQWIYDNGGVCVSYYSAGIYTKNADSKAYYQTAKTSSQSTHSVLIVGWDDDYSVENFREAMRPSSNGAWLCKNSWGEDAYDGYFWISYEEPSLCQFSTYRLSAKTEDTELYQYDGATSSVGLKVTKGANFFTADEDGTLQSVMFPVSLANTYYLKYTIKIYKVGKSTVDPESGRLLGKSVGNVSYLGYKNIDVSKLNISVKKGDRFAVVLSLTQTLTDEVGYLASEKQIDKGTGFVRNCTLQTGQSAIYMDDEWYDMMDVRNVYDAETDSYPSEGLGNLSIKAIVKNTSGNGSGQFDIARTLTDNSEIQAILEKDATVFQWQLDYVSANVFATAEAAGTIAYPKYTLANFTATMQGDSDWDGKLTLQDAFNTLRETTALSAGNGTTVTSTVAKNIDLDADDQVEVEDAFRILLYVTRVSAGETDISL